MRARNHTGNERRDMQRAGFRSDPRPPNGDTTASLRSTLRKQTMELRREDKRYRKLDASFHELYREHSRLQVDVKHLKSDNKILSSDISNFDEKLTYITDTYMGPYARTRGIRVQDSSYVTLDRVLEPMLGDALKAKSLEITVADLQSKVQSSSSQVQSLEAELTEMDVSQTEVQYLKDQVQSLQRQLLARVDKERVISDDHLGNEFRNLVALVKSLSRSVRFARDTELSEVLDTRVLLSGVRANQWGTRARKKFFIEAWTWSVLLEKTFRTPFTILGSNDTAMAEIWSGMFDNKHHHGWPVPSALCESWRYKTVEHAVETMDLIDEAKVSVRGREFPGGTPSQDAEGEDSQIRNEVANEIGTRLANLSSATDFQILPKVVEAAHTLALHMSLQRSRIQLTFPSVDDAFDGTKMTPLPDPDGEDRVDGVVAFVVRPALTKWGNAYGEYFDQRYDIVPALVQLQAHHEEAYHEKVMVKLEPL
ncbi:hypothetical protein C7974DRAFT_392579 [Boeremia exigua]|uniref:uncharacterized protein n=1 Tax=Boeremia exigua TaxID=749465 RepID=UPI001E8EBF15|nr:uncharacterized protein C7974DRAFT_392579 [Boeremia exigua]KAH6633343.1 hypothetical protein C7974DRAFT_392579 [Boeremia exigua]